MKCLEGGNARLGARTAAASIAACSLQAVWDSIVSRSLQGCNGEALSIAPDSGRLHGPPGVRRDQLPLRGAPRMAFRIGPGARAGSGSAARSGEQLLPAKRVRALLSTDQRAW